MQYNLPCVHQERAYEEFLSCPDVGDDGTLDARGLLCLARRLLPRARTRQLHYLLTLMHGADPDANGRFTFNELLTVFRAVPVTLLPAGTRIPPGFTTPASRVCMLRVAALLLFV